MYELNYIRKFWTVDQVGKEKKIWTMDQLSMKKVGEEDGRKEKKTMDQLSMKNVGKEEWYKIWITTS